MSLYKLSRDYEDIYVWVRELQQDKVTYVWVWELQQDKVTYVWVWWNFFFNNKNLIKFHRRVFRSGKIHVTIIINLILL
jgi:hypothetical protein